MTITFEGHEIKATTNIFCETCNQSCLEIEKGQRFCDECKGRIEREFEIQKKMLYERIVRKLKLIKAEREYNERIKMQTKEAANADS